jgi:hypothetical protein
MAMIFFSILSDTSRVLPQVMKSTSISAQIFFAYQMRPIVATCAAAATHAMELG